MAIPKFTKQAGKPLFPEIFWNRPTMRRRAGRLLVVGGQRHEFSLVQAIYQMAEAAGVGECQVCLPDSLQRMMGAETSFARFVPASASGSLGKAALGEIIALAGDFDGLVVGANLTNNAETAVMIEALVRQLEIPLIITEEVIEILRFQPALITGNPHALVVTTMNGLFALANHHHLPIAIKPGAGVVGKITILQQLAAISRCSYLVYDHEALVTAGGETSLTPLQRDLSPWPATAIGLGGVLWLQNQAKPLAALTTAAFLLAEVTREEPKGYSAIAQQIQTALRQFEQ